MSYSDDVIARRNLLDTYVDIDATFGDLQRNVTNSHKGLDALGRGMKPMASKDYRKLIFFTRPQLNFSEYNIGKNRRLMQLLNKDKYSMDRYARVMLDPNLPYKTADDLQVPISSPLVDSENPFITIFSNSLVTLTGWPDSTVPTWSSTPGTRKESMSLVDGVNDIYSEFDLDATFLNTKGEAGLKMINYWETIMGTNVANETSPYIELLIANERDYDTRIYVIVLDDDDRTVKRIACTGASFPINDPTGKMFDFDRNGNPATENSTYSIRFKSTGALYNDPVVAEDFNAHLSMFNDGMWEIDNAFKANNYGPDNAISLNHKAMSGLVKVPPELIATFNSLMYPRINLFNNELEWYTKIENISEFSDSKYKIITSLRD